MNTKKGVLYIAFGVSDKANYAKELEVSIKSLREMHPGISATLFTDINFRSIPIGHLFDHVEYKEVSSKRVKQRFLEESPYDITLYLDADTKIIGPIEEIFDLMYRFDIAAAQDHMRKDPKKSAIYPEYAAIPDGFPEYAGGVILFRKTLAVGEFFEVWRENYEEWVELTGKINDQPSFRVSLWEYEHIHICTLPPEFNMRTKKVDNVIPRIMHRHDMWRK